MSHLRRISLAELSLRNGLDHDEVWVAYRGLVYDLSQSRKWQKGLHYSHWAGQDLSDELKEAPHSEQEILRFPVLGKLIDN